MKLAFALAILLAPALRAQCPVRTAVTGFADLDGDRAIVASLAGPGVNVTFHTNRAYGWEAEQSSRIGDLFLVLYPTVAMDGDRAIAGSAESNGQRGQAYVFDRMGETWVQTRLQPTGPEGADFLGASVDISGDVAIVGASHLPIGGGDGQGRVHVFEFDGTSWSQTAELPTFGDSIDVEGDTIAIGRQWWSSAKGRVQVYRKIQGVWTRIVELRSPAGSAEDATFGTSVALHGDRMAVGATYSSVSQGGAVHIFRETASGWVALQELRPRQTFHDDDFGTSLAWSGSILLVGAPAYPTAHDGSVHRFEEIGGRFVETDVLHPARDSSSFGYQVAENQGNAIVFGYPVTTFFRLGIAESASFCPQPPNSTLLPGLLSMEGCDSLAGRTLTLHASDLPAHTLARSFLGGETPPVAFGDGYRCVGSPLFRLASGSADAAGEFRSAFDFDSPGGRELAPGSTWSFQVLYRDARSPLAGMNLTNAVSVGITP